MPIYLRITALWGGQAGSLVFWSWLLSVFAICGDSAQMGPRPGIPALGDRGLRWSRWPSS